MVHINFNEILNSSFDEFKIPTRQLVLYGCGIFGTATLEALNEYNIKPIAVCDSNPNKIGTNFFGHTVISFEKAIQLFSDFDILIASGTFYNEIKEYVLKYVTEDRISIINLNRSNVEEFREIITGNKDKLEEIFNKLTDDTSRDIMLNIIKAKLTNNPMYFQKIYSEHQYFNELINLSDEEYFLDGGAFLGDTMKEFVEITNNKYKKIYCFEPSKNIFKQLEESKRKFFNNDSRIILYNKGLYNCNKVVGFNSKLPTGGHRVECALSIEENIEVVTIDDIINDKVTFIKMDIEGSELQALEGAKNTILKYKPKLAISVYHKADDLVKILDFIMNLGLDYKYYLRHHGISPMINNETVFYAV